MWNNEVQSESESINPDISVKRLVAGCCLILIPHSDDEWVGCSRVLIDGKDVTLCNLDMGGGDTPSLHQVRYREMSKVASEYGRSIITIKENKTDELKKVIYEIKPDYILLPHYIDWHPEHIEVMKILYTAIKEGANGFRVMMYQVSCPIVTGVTHALPMTKEQWQSKWIFFKSHYKTQITIPYQRFSLNEVINGRYVEAYAAEVYSEVSIDEWLKLVEFNLLSEEQIAGLKGNLGSITKMRQYIKRLQ